MTTLGSSTITMSGDNATSSGGLPWGWVDLGGRSNSSTGITIPPNTTFRIIVSGRVTANPKNPAPTCAPPNETYYWQGSYGPAGTGNAGVELGVYLQFRETGGANNQINFYQAQTGRSAPDTARSDYFYTAAGGILWAGHAGMYLTCGETINGVTTVRGMYQLSGTRTITVESETNALKLTATPSYVRAGTPVTFTYSRADGSTSGSMPMWRRAWIKDPGVTASGPSCGWEVNPCTSPVYGSGTMEVDIGINNKVYTASAHVTVYSTFVLEADQATVRYGDTVAFTPKYNDVAGSAACWQWKPDVGSPDPKTCVAQSVPRKVRITQSGTMWAFTADVAGDSDSKHVEVRPRERLQLNPSGTTWAAEGDTVTFTVSATGGATPQQIHWSSSDDVVFANRARPREWSQRMDAAGVAATTCIDGATTCTDVVTATYVRYVSAVVDDSLQADSAVVFVTKLKLALDDSSDYAISTPPDCLVGQHTPETLAYCRGVSPVSPYVTDSLRIKVAIDSIRARGGLCVTLANIADSLVKNRTIKLFNPKDDDGFGGAAPLGGGSSGPNSWMVVSYFFVKKAYDHQHALVFTDRGETIKMDLQYVLSHELNHLNGERHLGGPYKTLNTPTCGSVP